MTSDDAPRKIGRPSKGQRVRTGLRLPVDLHTRMLARAESLGLNVNDYVEALITQDLAEADEATGKRAAA